MNDDELEVKASDSYATAKLKKQYAKKVTHLDAKLFHVQM